MMIRRICLPASLLAALVAAGCAGNSGGTSDAAAPGAPGSAPASLPPDPPASLLPDPSVEPSPGPTMKVPGKPAPGAGRVETITGTVNAGVEPGCLLLSAAAGPYLLLLDDPALRTTARPGGTYTVTGRAEPGMITTCQQGIPFVVTAIRAS